MNYVDVIGAGVAWEQLSAFVVSVTLMLSFSNNAFKALSLSQVSRHFLDFQLHQLSPSTNHPAPLIVSLGKLQSTQDLLYLLKATLSLVDRIVTTDLSNSNEVHSQLETCSYEIKGRQH